MDAAGSPHRHPLPLQVTAAGLQGLKPPGWADPSTGLSPMGAVNVLGFYSATEALMSLLEKS